MEKEGKRGGSIFEAMARSRGEWLAQGVLIHAIEHQPSVQARLAEFVNASAFRSCKVVPEVPDDRAKRTQPGVGVWRMDLQVVFEPGPKVLRIELKLGAPFSRVQLEALSEDGTLLVCPEVYRKRKDVRAASLTWAEIATCASSDMLLARLLDEIETYGSGQLEGLSWDEAKKEFRQFVDSPVVDSSQEGWPKLYRFLSTIDQTLQAWDSDRCLYLSSSKYSWSRNGVSIPGREMVKMA